MTANLRSRRAVSLDELQHMARTAMETWFRVIRAKAQTKARTPEEFYGFRAEDVAAMHYRKHGFGRGVWFRLKDGRVVDAKGKSSEPDHIWYEATSH
jgi:hypothetical protein